MRQNRLGIKPDAYANPLFVKLTRYEAFSYVYILPAILILGLIKNYILLHAFKCVRIRSNLGRLLRILLYSDIILWILLLFYPFMSSVGVYTNSPFSESQAWNSFVIYFLQPALNTFFILNIHLVTLMAANQYLMYAFPRVHNVWKRKKYILKYVLIVDFFIIASMEYTMCKWLQVTRYRQPYQYNQNYYGSQQGLEGAIQTPAPGPARDIYYYDVVPDPSDNYISYEVTNNLILVIAPLIFLLFLSFSNLRYYLRNKWQQNVGNGKRISPDGDNKQPATLQLQRNPPNSNQQQQLPSTSQYGGGTDPNKNLSSFESVPEEKRVFRTQESKNFAASKAEEKLLSILIIVLSFQYLICNIPIAIIQILYPVYECYPGICKFRFYVLVATMLQLLNPNIDFYIFYGLKSLRRAVGNLWVSTRHKKKTNADKGGINDSNSTLDEADMHSEDKLTIDDNPEIRSTTTTKPKVPNENIKIEELS